MSSVSNNVVSFVEESCFSGEQFRSVRREVVFTAHIFGLGPDKILKEDFSADYGVWYDHTDEYLLSILNSELPGTEWGRFVYHPKMDHSAIDLINPETNKIIGSIHVRRGSTSNPELSGENLGGKVVSMVGRNRNGSVDDIRS